MTVKQYNEHFIEKLEKKKKNEGCIIKEIPEGEKIETDKTSYKIQK